MQYKRVIVRVLIKSTFALVSSHLVDEGLKNLTTILRSHGFLSRCIKRYGTNMVSPTRSPTVPTKPFNLRPTIKWDEVVTRIFRCSGNTIESVYNVSLLRILYFTHQLDNRTKLEKHTVYVTSICLWFHMFLLVQVHLVLTFHACSTAYIAIANKCNRTTF